MASHLSSIGFPVQNEQDLYSLAEKVSEKAKPHEVDKGFYLSYQDPSGAMLWLHADQQRQIAGMNPHFAGPSVMQVKIVRSLHKKQDHDFEGSYFAWAAPEEERDHQEGAYPFLFDAPDYLRHHNQQFPAILNVQIAAFAHEFHIFPDEEAFHTETAHGPAMSPKAFIPAGLFPVDGELEAAAPTAHALINGLVIDAQKRTNQMTGKGFWWVQIESFAGTYDAVIDPLLIRTEPKPGNIATGSFWLSGMILDHAADQKLRNTFLRLLRGKRSS